VLRYPKAVGFSLAQQKKCFGEITMNAPLQGTLLFWSETGTEGGHWALQEDRYPGSYDGLHVLEDGDHLRVLNEDGSSRWEGLIQLKSYPAFTEHVFNCWIHADQIGMERQAWAEMFFKQLKAELQKKNPRVAQGREIYGSSKEDR
jgi:hypothetical protein